MLNKYTHYKRLQGFTLSELLVSLSVFALIATLTLPTLFSSIKEPIMKAQKREAISTLQILYSTARSKGIRGAEMTAYVLDNITGKKVCRNNATVEGCFTWENPDQGGVEFYNGVVICSLWRDSVHKHENIWIDINGTAGPNEHGKDRIHVVTCTQDGPPATYGCLPGNNVAGKIYPGPAEIDHYNSIFN